MERDKDEYLNNIFLGKDNVPLLINLTEGKKINFSQDDITLKIPKAHGLAFRYKTFYKPLEIFAFLDEEE